MSSEAGRFTDLAALSEPAVAYCPDAPLVHLNQGVALDHLERLAQAAASYERPKAGRSRPSPTRIKESGKATFP